LPETFKGEEMKDFNDVLAFHQQFDLPRDVMMRLMPNDAEVFRRIFLNEEASEFNEAWHEENLVKTADALFDFVYVAIGTALFIGCPRSGPVGRWPNYVEVSKGAIDNGLTLSVEHLAPRLLPPGLQVACAATLKDRIDLFINAYSSAKSGEDGGLNLSLYALKLCCISAYTIGAMMHLPWARCWQHVQDSNMAKKRAERDGSNSKRHSPWDVVKPDGWVAPDAKIAMELQEAGWRVPVMMAVDNKTGRVEMIRGDQR
jgi:predicted HAD superfamily Cof-like phosphohydrolase